VADGHIDIRPSGSDTWQTLPSSYDGTHVSARLDDEHLKTGSYDLRAYAIDRAGNERTSQDLVNGGSAVIGLPIRIRTHLRAGIAQRRGGHRRSIRTRARIHVRYGHAVRLSGRLLSTDGNPVQGADVLVYSQARRTDAPVRVVASVRTSRLGGFSYRAPKGVSRTIRFRFNGTSTIRPSLHDVALLVTARSTIHTDRKRFVNGESVHFRGRLRGTSVPATGKLLELQVKLRGHWHTFATTHAGRNRRWRYEYRFDGTRGNQRYEFRARIPREANYPYEPGASPAARVFVRGL